MDSAERVTVPRCPSKDMATDFRGTMRLYCPAVGAAGSLLTVAGVVDDVLPGISLLVKALPKSC